MFTTAEDSLMVLVDSDKMNAYAWRKELFKVTLSSLKSGLRNKSSIVEGNGRPYIVYRISGFVIAFQVWIYEILPIWEGKVCNQIGSRSPRILNWTSNVHRKLLIQVEFG
ncbi:DUF1985 domain-containing protein [Abeliophyllum distichum]|uniref:DUF1985 domain-containing protein n=1 Tax=Abeliophyllum distichum TaxID=126358 RepID=A0ABD1V6P4_9LAMI